MAPLIRTARLGKTAKGKKNFLGKKTAARNKQVLIIVPTSCWGPAKEKGTINDKAENPTKTKPAVGFVKFIGKLKISVFELMILEYIYDSARTYFIKNS